MHVCVPSPTHYTSWSIVGSVSCPGCGLVHNLWRRPSWLQVHPVIAGIYCHLSYWTCCVHSLGLSTLRQTTAAGNGENWVIWGKFFSTGVGSWAFESAWTMRVSGILPFPSRDHAWPAGATMARFVWVSNLTDILTEASHWMVFANRCNGEKRKENSKDYLFFFFFKGLRLCHLAVWYPVVNAALLEAHTILHMGVKIISGEMMLCGLIGLKYFVLWLQMGFCLCCSTFFQAFCWTS